MCRCGVGELAVNPPRVNRPEHVGVFVTSINQRPSKSDARRRRAVPLQLAVGDVCASECVLAVLMVG
jgi:hypothetical protein